MGDAPLRIALDLSCVYEQPRTGVGYAGLYLASALLKLGLDNDYRLFAVRPRGVPSEFPNPDAYFSRQTVFPLARRLKVLLWPSIQWPPIEWFTGRVDIVHEFFHQLPAARHAIRMVTVHDLSFIRHPETHTDETVRVQTRLLHHIARHADACVAVSQSCKDDMVELLGMPPERIHVAPCGINPEEFEQPLDAALLDSLKARLGTGQEYLVHLGTIEPRKNLPRLLQAYARLRARARGVPKLVLIGKIGWKAEATLRAIDELRLADDVIHAGYLSRHEALTLLRGARLCVYPSLYEGFGLPVLEAMASGVPVVTSNVSALPEVVGDTGIFVDPHSAESIETALAQALEQPDRLADNAVRGRVRALSMTWEHSARELAQVYRNVFQEIRA